MKTETTPETILDDVNRILSEYYATSNDIKSIEMDEAALKFFVKFWLTRDESDGEVEAQLNHQSFRIGDLVGSYRGVKVFCGYSGCVRFYDSLGQDIAKLNVKGFTEDNMELQLVFDKLKEVLELDAEADEFDVLIAVAKLQSQPAKNNFLPHTIGTGVREIAPWEKTPTVIYNNDTTGTIQDKIPAHLLKRAEEAKDKAAAKARGVTYTYPLNDDIYDAVN